MQKQDSKIFLCLSIFIVIFFLAGVCVAEPMNPNSRGLEWRGPQPADDISFLRGKFRAVVIGNNQYKDNNGIWKNLETAVNDAESVAQVLTARFGFQDITLLKNADRKKILLSLKELSARVEPLDSVLVYYAGHGHLEDDDRRGYWIPVDGQGLDDTTFIRNSTIRDEIRLIAEKSKHTLLLSDSCFSGSLLRDGNRGPSNYELSKGYYIKVGNKRSVQVLTAGGKEFVDDNYRNSGHSPFTYFLLNELNNTVSPFVSFSEVATNVIKAVANNVDQTPEAGVLQGAGDELGEFIFARQEIKRHPLATETIEKTGLEIITQVNNSEPTTPIIPAFRF